ncbi:MAG: hypothetical protein LBH98_09580 [Chitinispirillales bacterium]|jgi:hypothetical protein|nr:hypothetical protein [Chitinispirillales bacterium]
MIKRREKCPPPVRKTSKFKIIVFLILTPLVTWYSKQSSNNPWQMRSEYYLENDNDNFSIVFFEQNVKKKDGDLRIYLSENPPIFDTTSFFISNDKLLKYNTDNQTDTIRHLYRYGWSFRFFVWGIAAISDETKIIISSNNFFEKNEQCPILYDILISSANSSQIKKERFFFRPKMTVWFTNETAISQISNVYIPKSKDRFRIIKKGEKLLISSKSSQP